MPWDAIDQMEIRYQTSERLPIVSYRNGLRIVINRLLSTPFWGSYQRLWSADPGTSSVVDDETLVYARSHIGAYERESVTRLRPPYGNPLVSYFSR